jgi:hypothetical protein
MGYVCREDVAKALKMQGFRRKRGQEVPRIGVLLERMGCLNADQILRVSGDCSSRPRGPLRPAARNNRFAPALEPIRRLAETSSVQQALGWLAQDVKGPMPQTAKPQTAKPQTAKPQTAKPQSTPAPALKAQEPTPPLATALKAPGPAVRTPEPTPRAAQPKTKRTRAVEAVRAPKEAARSARLVESELHRLRDTITRLTLRLAEVEADADTLRVQRDGLGLELERVTHAMIFKEDLIDALRNQVRRLGS